MSLWVTLYFLKVFGKNNCTVPRRFATYLTINNLNTIVCDYLSLWHKVLLNSELPRISSVELRKTWVSSTKITVYFMCMFLTHYIVLIMRWRPHCQGEEEWYMFDGYWNLVFLIKHSRGSQPPSLQWTCSMVLLVSSLGFVFSKVICW